MKKQLFFLIMILLVSVISARGGEWRSVVALLNKEAAHFEGKSGFIRLMKSEYNVFRIEELSVSDTMMTSAMWLSDRFENQPAEQYLRETIVLMYEPIIKSARIVYDHDFYFEVFPDTQFLLIEFEEAYIHQVVSIYKDVNNAEQDQSVQEDTTHQLLLPIRSKNRSKILSAIDQYQSATFKNELNTDMNH